MEQRIILISGLAASGKTTVGELLQQKLGNCARVESDFLILVKPFEPGQKLTQLKIQNNVSLVKNFIRRQYQNIIVVGAVWNQEELNLFIKELGPQEGIVSLFWLDVSQETRFERALKRHDPDDNLDWLKKMEKLFPVPTLPLELTNGFSHVVNIGAKTPEQITVEILSFLHD